MSRIGLSIIVLIIFVLLFIGVLIIGFDKDEKVPVSGVVESVGCTEGATKIDINIYTCIGGDWIYIGENSYLKG